MSVLCSLGATAISDEKKTGQFLEVGACKQRDVEHIEVGLPSFNHILSIFLI